MSPEEMFSFGIIFTFIAYFLEFHPFWLVSFLLMTLFAGFQMLRKERRKVA